MNIFNWFINLFRPQPRPVPVPVPTPVPPRPVPVPPPAPDPAPDAIAVALLNAANTVRAEYPGLRPLSLDGRLCASAARFARDCAARGFLPAKHIGSDGSTDVQRIVAAGYPANRSTGECAAEGQPDAGAVVAAWLGDRAHRDIVLGPQFSFMGGAMARGTAANAVNPPFWVADFGG